MAHDFLYSASAVIDATGAVLERYDYEPYGAPSLWSGDYADTRPLTTGTCSFLFTGQMYDAETGLYHYKARVLHPAVGRFLQRDPGGYVDAMALYPYTASSPLDSLDPLGLYWVSYDREQEEGSTIIKWRLRVRSSTGFLGFGRTTHATLTITTQKLSDGLLRVRLGAGISFEMATADFRSWIERADQQVRDIVRPPGRAEDATEAEKEQAWRTVLIEKLSRTFDRGAVKADPEDSFIECIERYIRYKWRKDQDLVATGAALVESAYRASTNQWLIVAGGLVVSGAARAFSAGSGATPGGRVPGKALQTGGHTIKPSTARALGLNRGQAKQAIEALKKFQHLPPDYHSLKFMANGDVFDANRGTWLGNLYEFL